MATKKKKVLRTPRKCRHCGHVGGHAPSCPKFENLGPMKELDKNVEGWIDTLLNAKRAKSQAERTIAEHETLLLRELGNFQRGRAPNGIQVIAKKMSRGAYEAPACTFIQLKIVQPEN